jgi:uncharacterized protein (DUF1697 family)
MPADRFVALLRGVNVGGHHRMPMAELRGALAAAGFADVRTYIQSGNVVFDRPGTGVASTDESAIAAEVAAIIDVTFGWSVPVLVRRFDDIERIAASHPAAGGDVPAKWLHVFLLERVPVGSGAEHVLDPERYAPDRWIVDGREVYVTYPEGSGRSKLTIDVVERALGVTATARNVSTLAKVVDLGRQGS